MDFGAHVSSSGGIDTAIDRIEAIGGYCAQVFTQSPRMWRPTNHTPEAIARFKALSTLRRKPEQELDEETAEAIEDTSDTPDVTLEKKERGEVIRKCLTSLSVEHREIVDLVYYHEKSVEEVAEIVGIPEATVKTRMFYARKKLAELLKAQGIERGWP